MNPIFKSKYPILEAPMNGGSTLPLALAVHNAGGYPSLCSWTYKWDFYRMRSDLEQFVNITGSNRIHLSFETDEFHLYGQTKGITNPEKICHQMIRDYNIPTVEIIHGNSNSPRPSNQIASHADERLLRMVTPISEFGTKIFNRIYDPVSEEYRQKFLFDGFCVKGKNSAGFGGTTYTVMELFKIQQQLTPSACVIPYGGIGTSTHVKEYFDLGANMVGVGTVLAFSEESTIKTKTKEVVANSKKDDIVSFQHQFDIGSSNVIRKQSAIPLKIKYDGEDDCNKTFSLFTALYGEKADCGHIYVGESIDNISSIRGCSEIIQDLVSEISHHCN